MVFIQTWACKGAHAYLIESVEGVSNGDFCALAPQRGGLVLEDHICGQKVSEILVAHQGWWSIMFPSYARLF